MTQEYLGPKIDYNQLTRKRRGYQWYIGNQHPYNHGI